MSWAFYEYKDIKFVIINDGSKLKYIDLDTFDYRDPYTFIEWDYPNKINWHYFIK